MRRTITGGRYRTVRDATAIAGIGNVTKSGKTATGGRGLVGISAAANDSPAACRETQVGSGLRFRMGSFEYLPVRSLGFDHGFDTELTLEYITALPVLGQRRIDFA